MKITLQCQNLNENYISYLKSLPSIVDVNVFMPDIVVLNVKNINFLSSLEKYNIKIINCTLSYQNFDINMLEYMSNKERNHEILRENDHFNLKDFYLNKLSGAVAVITQNDIVFAYAICDHKTVTNAIYNYLYNSQDEEYFNNSDYLWQQSALKYDNIIIQFCSDSPSMIWLPSNMNEFQKSALSFIQNNMINIMREYNIKLDYFITKAEELRQNKSKYKNP